MFHGHVIQRSGSQLSLDVPVITGGMIRNFLKNLFYDHDYVASFNPFTLSGVYLLNNTTMGASGYRSPFSWPQQQRKRPLHSPGRPH